MSATTVDQRPKGQGNKVQNGSMRQKDGVNEDEFEPYLNSQTNQNNSYPQMSDPYMPSYYAPSIGFPYSLGEAPWSTAGDPPMPYLTAYGQMSNGEHHFIPDGVFSQPGALGNTPPFLSQHGFNFFPGNADYSTWGTSVSQGQSTQSYTNSYGYTPSSLGRAIADGQAGFGSEGQLGKVPVLSGIDQGMAGLKLGTDVGVAVTKAVGSPLGGTLGMSSVAANSLPPLVSPSAPKPTSWAAIARKPAKPQPKVKPKANIVMGGPAVPPPPIKHNMNIGTWDDKGPLNKPTLAQGMMPPQNMVQQQPLIGQPLLQSPLPHQHHQQQAQHQHHQQAQHQHHQQAQHQHHQQAQHQHHQQAQHQHHQQAQHQHHQQAQHHHHHPPQHQHHQPFQLQSLQSSQPPQQMPPGPPHPHPNFSPQPGPPPPMHQHQQPLPPLQSRWVAPRNRGTYSQGGVEGFGMGVGGVPLSASPCSGEVHPVLEKLRTLNNYNPKDFDWNLKNGRVFIIKSYSEDDIHRSIKYSIWCSTEHGNKRLDGAFRSLGAKGPLYLLFSVNGSGHFCGVAEMRSPVDYNAYAGVWSQDKWKGKFTVKWAFVKDVPNNQLRHIRLENNDNKPVTNSRDTQEVPLEKAKQVLKIIATFKHTTSIFDDFAHYENRQEEEEALRRERNRNKQ